MFQTVVIGGIPTIVATRRQLAERMVADCFAAKGTRDLPRLVFSSNGQGIALAGSDPEFHRAMCEADMVHADGMSVVTASRYLTPTRLPERIATTDFFHDAAAAASEAGLSFFMLGASEEENLRACQETQRLYPTLRIVGRRHGYFRPDEEEEICREIRDSGADVLWVALGKPLQEHWCVRNRERLRGLGWVKTCGGLYGFLSGSTRRAPAAVQTLGFEWLYRTMQDPRRLFWRYLATNPQAIWYMIRRSGGTANVAHRQRG